MGGLGGKGKGKKRRERTQDSESVFDRKNGEFVRNKAHKLPPKPEFTQDDDNKVLPRRLRDIMQHMGKSQEALAKAAAAKQSQQEAKSKNKYKHKDLERGGTGGGSLWLDAASAAEAADTPKGDDASDGEPPASNQPSGGGNSSAPAASEPTPTLPVSGTRVRGEDTGTMAPAVLSKASARRKEKKKERLKLLHARKMNKTLKHKLQAEMEEDDLHPQEFLQDEVLFGECALQPPALTIKRKRGHESYKSTGGEQLTEPPTKGQKLGAIMARQMGNVKAETKQGAELKMSSHEEIRLQIIEQYRRKKNRLPQLPTMTLQNLSVIS